MSEMSQRQMGSETAVCPTCGAALGSEQSAYGSSIPVTCLVCYGEPENVPVAPPAPPAKFDKLDKETAAEAPLPREVGTHTNTED